MPNELSALRRHVFLTGNKQVGKSTLLRNLIAENHLVCSGFETQAFYLNNERRGFTLHGRIEMPPFENDCICCVRIEENRSIPVLPAFDANGSRILQRSRQFDAPFILMDELGRLERQAYAFIDEVYACLDCEKRVLGVLQKCSASHIEGISRRSDVTVLTVTPENRDALLRYLTEQFK